MQGKVKSYLIVVTSLCICAAAVTVLVWRLVPAGGDHWACAVHFGILAAVVELLAVNLREGDGTSISPTSPVLWAAICVIGPFRAIAVSAASAAVSLLARCACFYIVREWDARSQGSAERSGVGKVIYGVVRGIGSVWEDRPATMTVLPVVLYLATLALDLGAAGLSYYLLGGRFLMDSGGHLDVLREFAIPFLALVTVSGFVHLAEYAVVTASIDPIPGARGVYGVLLRMRLAVVETALPIVKGQMFFWVVALLLAYLYSQIGLLGFLLAITPVLALRDFFNQWVEERSAYLNTITTLATYMQHYHPYTRGHLKRVADMSERLARELRLPVESIRHMNAAGFLHDIGKIGVSEEILDKTSQLTDDEWARIKEHPVKGAEIISHLEFLEGIVDWIRFHHKWHDGRGYPDVDGAARVPIEAAIIATADAFDAMTDDRELTIEWKCDSCGYQPEEGRRPAFCPECGAEKRRSYREPRTLDDAVDELRRGAGSQFHPRVVKAFLSMVERDGIRLNA